MEGNNQIIDQDSSFNNNNNNNNNSGGGNGLSIAGMILGILGAVLAFIPCFIVIAFVLSIVGIILSALGLQAANRSNSSNGIAKAGLILSIVGLAICFIWGIFFSSAALLGS